MAARTVTCPDCGAPQQIAEDQLAKTCRCPRCGKTFAPAEVDRGAPGTAGPKDSASPAPVTLVPAAPAGQPATPVEPAGAAPAAAPEKRRPMLAWWALFPTLGFVAARLIAGWPEEGARSSIPGAEIGGLIGAIGVGVLISILLAWIVYRLAHRSRMAASLTFSGLMVLMLAGSVLVPLARTRAEGRPADKPVTASFGAFAFDVPAGWSRARPGRGKTAAMIMLKRGGTTVGVVMVDVGRPTLPDARQAARAIVGATGEVLPEPARVDGAEGVRAGAKTADLSKPRHVVVVYRGGKVYIIMGGAAGGTDVSDAFERVLKTWRWTDS